MDAADITIDQLRDIGLFGALDDTVLTWLLQKLPQELYETGAVLCEEGERARDFFVLIDGELEVVKQTREKTEARVALLGPGDWFGEMAVLDVQPRSATVRVLAPSRVLRVRATDLDALYRTNLKAYTIIVLNLARELSRRLRVADGVLAELVATLHHSYLGGPAGR